MLKRIYGLIAAILLISMILTGLVSFSIMDKFNRETNDIKLDSAIDLVAHELGQGKSYEEAAELIDLTFTTDKERIRITIVDLDGNVLFDNESAITLETNHLHRPEIYAAITDRSYGKSIRKSDTLHINIYYYAKYEADLQLVIRAALPMNIFIQNVRNMGWQLMMILAAAMLAVATVGILAARLVARPLISLMTAANKMASGDYSARVTKTRDDKSEIGDLSLAFNKMAQKIQNVVEEMKDRNIRMDIILNSIGSPIIAVDENLMVTFFNNSLIEEFAYHRFPSKGVYPFISIVRSPETEGLIRKALADGTEKTDKVRISTHNETRIYRVSVSLTPLSNDRGAIILFQDITQIDKLQKMRSEFVANVTHELKTPLTSIRGFVDTLRNGAMQNPEVSGKFLDIIDVEAERLHNLISDILSLSEIEEMRADTDCTEFDIYPLIDEVIVLLDDEATEKTVAVIVEEGFTDVQGADLYGSGISQDESYSDEKPQSLMIRANRNRIKQVLINLIENAIRYNIPGGKVYVSAGRNADGELVIRVRDTGNGISRENLPRVFERFYRVDKGRSKELGGTGLGLSIVKHIAMLYKGNVTAESDIGRGSVFTVTLKV
ncbi:MAG: HAMP domain-containing sensor histidine kinase [Saccharofermentanales bacterium]